MVRLLLGRLRAIDSGSVSSTGELGNQFAVLFWKPQGLMSSSNTHKGIDQETCITWHKRGDKQLHMFFNHADMVRFAVATFNINQTVQLVFRPVVKYSQPEMNYGESASRPPTSLALRQCIVNEQTMERRCCAVVGTIRPHDLVNHASRHRSRNMLYVT